jgi:hypothetical protein
MDLPIGGIECLAVGRAHLIEFRSVNPHHIEASSLTYGEAVARLRRGVGHPTVPPPAPPYLETTEPGSPHRFSNCWAIRYPPTDYLKNERTVSPQKIWLFQTRRSSRCSGNGYMGNA